MHDAPDMLNLVFSDQKPQVAYRVLGVTGSISSEVDVMPSFRVRPQVPTRGMAASRWRNFCF